MRCMNNALIRAATSLHAATRPSATLGLGALACALVIAAIAPALAANGIQRCVAADGVAVYTDQPCGAMSAKRTPMSAELIQRIAGGQGANTVAAGASADGTAAEFAGAGFDGALRPAAVAVARRSPASGCARTPTQLAMDLQGAWALGDVNSVAESYHWVGIDHRQGEKIMQRLDRLSAQPLQQAEYFDAQIGGGSIQLADAGTGSHPSGEGAGIMQVTFGAAGTPNVQDFEVAQYRGCYFIGF